MYFCIGKNYDREDSYGLYFKIDNEKYLLNQHGIKSCSRESCTANDTPYFLIRSNLIKYFIRCSLKYVPRMENKQ